MNLEYCLFEANRMFKGLSLLFSDTKQLSWICVSLLDIYGLFISFSYKDIPLVFEREEAIKEQYAMRRFR